ncbi:helix-turn-helix domain-containing protein [Erythrobacter sp.]|uniref:helix-turn-helix domain-containing protein n=1 Tax=Erythrobacter sp. TaxID=1042 RepID=UPI001B25FD9F|nr:helix-turn-helix domain-containing protein [Erythrobacter sp.]MBO6527528.1 helix-turn-helix domain-containing protein [Erythrobacter sp.]MBO6530208.1 helix-turn-helix domain-containing protein [Erythrobacter sp.]
MQANERIDTTVFDTASVPRAERFAVWRESADVAIEAALHDADRCDHFGAHITSALIEDVMVVRSRISAQIVSRSVQRVARDGVDHYQFILFARGKSESTMGTRTSITVPGQWVVVDYGEPMTNRLTDYENLNFYVPRRRLAPLLDTPDAIHGAQFVSESGPGKLLRDYLESLCTIAPEIRKAQAPAAGEALVQLAALALNSVTWDETDPPALANNALLLRAQALINANIQDCDLSPEWIAATMGLSRARLYRIFTPRGGIAASIRETRLRRCYTDLLSLRHAHEQLSQIAYRWGFSDPGHFSKVFKSRFGMSPTELRNEGASAAAARNNPRFADAVDLTYSHWIGGLG